ncbi:MAG: hypothetical protein WA705_14825 [Candidatus Ozemobacteraceae bacterium]
MVNTPIEQLETLKDAQLHIQLEALEKHLTTVTSDRLIAWAAELPDSEPLAWLGAELRKKDLLKDPASSKAFIQALSHISEPALRRVLNRFVSIESPTSAWDSLPDILNGLLDCFSIERLSSICFLDRIFRNHLPDALEKRISLSMERLQTDLTTPSGDEYPLEPLILLSSSRIEELRKTCESSSPEAPGRLERVLDRLVGETMRILTSAPKGISQANAEELLSKRVYADPGHFLVELLQNAEDSQAKEWRVRFEEHQISVWHDGKTFDVRDLVGVTSIGQTTKRKQQIGFFGVGFKSIYEITDRPQVYSGLYNFEIVDISVPKRLSRRPDGFPDGGTLLILPLQVVQAANLYAKAAVLDPCVLITLRNIEIIDLTLAANAGGPARRLMKETVSADRTLSTVYLEPEKTVSPYFVQDDEFSFTLGKREAGKPDRASVMIGVLHDGFGNPVPLPPNSATLYSYLPTPEHSGFKFFIQSHFDLLIDRERIGPDSQWNRWILSQVPTQLARLFRRLTDGLSPIPVKLLKAFLSIIPKPDELNSPLFRNSIGGLPQEFAPLPCFPHANGKNGQALETLIVKPHRFAALVPNARIPAMFLRSLRQVDGTAGLLDPSLDDRSIDIARFLGVREITASELIQGFSEAVGSSFTASEGLLPGTVEPIADFCDIALSELERLSRDGNEAEFSRLREAIRSLPLFPDHEGKLSPVTSTGPVRGNPCLRKIYSSRRVFLHPALDAVSEVPSPLSSTALKRLTMLYDQICLPELTTEILVQDLETTFGGLTGPIEKFSLTSWPLAPDELTAVFRLVSEAGPALQTRFARLPLFPAIDGLFYPMARNPGDRAGVLLAKETRLSNQLVEFYDKRRPIVCAEALQGLAVRILRSLSCPPLDFDALLADFEGNSGFLVQSANDAERVMDLLENLRDELHGKTKTRLVVLPIWPDQTRTLKPLQGENRCYIPRSPEMRTLFSEISFISESLINRPLLGELGIDLVGGEEVARAIIGDRTAAPFQIDPASEALEKCYRYLVLHADEVGGRTRELLKTRAQIPCDDGLVRAIREVKSYRDTQIRSLYREFSSQAFLSSDSVCRKALDLLQVSSSIPIADLPVFLQALAQRLVETCKENRQPDVSFFTRKADGCLDLLSYLAGKALLLSHTDLIALLSLPLFPDEEGKLGSLGDLENPDQVQAIYLCEPFLRPLLKETGLRVFDERFVQVMRALAKSVRHSTGTLKDIVHRLKSLKPLEPGGKTRGFQTPRALRLIMDLFLERKDDLAKDFPPTISKGKQASNAILNALSIWPTITGGVLQANDAIASEQILTVFEPTEPERRKLERRILEAYSAEIMGKLAPLVVSRAISDVLLDLAQGQARPGFLLERQPGFLSSFERIAGVWKILVSDRTDEEFKLPGKPPLVDGAGHLKLEPLKIVDENVFSLFEGLPSLAGILHPEMATLLPEQVRKALPMLPPGEVIAVFGQPAGQKNISSENSTKTALSSPERRSAFFHWLILNEADIFGQPEYRKQLAELPLFPTQKGRLVRIGELIPDAEMPDLDVDWKPSTEIPRELLAILSRRLETSAPSPEVLVEKHLIPRYLQAVRDVDRECAANILVYLAAMLSRFPGDASKPNVSHGSGSDGLVQSLPSRRSSSFSSSWEILLPMFKRLPAGVSAFPVEGNDGSFHPVTDLHIPRPHLERPLRRFSRLFRLPAERFKGGTLDLLKRLGARELPTLPRMKSLLLDPPREACELMDLAAIVHDLYSANPTEFQAAIPLDAPWILDREGRCRRPSHMFAWTPDTEDLIGPFLDYYPDRDQMSILGPDVANVLPFRNYSKISPEDVVRHLSWRSASKSSISFSVYKWLNAYLSRSPSHLPHLRQLLDNPPSQASGGLVAASQSLGNQDKSQKLSRGIPWIYTDDGQWMHASRTIAFRAFHLFGDFRGYWEKAAQELPALIEAFDLATGLSPALIIGFFNELAELVASHGDAELLAKNHSLACMLPALYASLAGKTDGLNKDIPFLLCREIGGRGWSPESPKKLRIKPPTTKALFLSDTPELETAFGAIGVLYIAEPGRPEERENAEKFFEHLGIKRLRDAFKTIPDPRRGTDCSESAADRIQAFRATIKAFRGVLPRIKKGRRDLAPTCWKDEPRLRTILEPGKIRAIAGLSVIWRLDGVGETRIDASAVFDGASGILFIEASILKDLDTRLFELGASLVGLIFEGPGFERVADLLDILLPLKSSERMNAYLSARHFPVVDIPLAGAPEMALERLNELFSFGLERKLSNLFPALKQVGFTKWQDNPAIQAGFKIFDAGTPRSDWAPRAAHLLLVALALPETPSGLEPILTKVFEAESISDLPPGLFAPPREPERQIEPSPAPIPRPPVAEGTPVAPSSSWATPTPSEELGSSGEKLMTDLWGQISNWLGLGDENPALKIAPAQGASELRRSGFTPRAFIPHQLWANSESRSSLVSAMPSSVAYCSPVPLPSPYIFGIHGIGTEFDSASQSYVLRNPPQLMPLESMASSSREVMFAAKLSPGRSVLPMPMLGTLSKNFRVLEGDPKLVKVERFGFWGGWMVSVGGNKPVNIRYSIDLRLPPDIPSAPASPPRGSLFPWATPLHVFPSEMRNFIKNLATSPLDQLGRALEVRDFITSNFIYDPNFLDLPRVKRTLEKAKSFGGSLHILAMLAGGDENCLGRGVCYEFNVTLTELLRHLGLPSMLASGWLFDDGYCDHVDHVFTVLLLDTVNGKVLFPLDATSQNSVGTHSQGLKKVEDGLATLLPRVGTVSSPTNRGWEPHPPPSPNQTRIQTQEGSVGLIREAMRRIKKLVSGQKARILDEALAALNGDPSERNMTRARNFMASVLTSEKSVDALIEILAGKKLYHITLPEEFETLVQLGLVKKQEFPAVKLDLAD